MKTIQIQVTQSDIDNGEPENSNICPIALAISRTLAIEPEDIEVLDDFVDFSAAGLINAPLPVDAQRFIVRFDEELEVMPFRFDLKMSKEPQP